MKILESFGVAPIVEKMVKNRLRRFRDVEKRPVDSMVREVNQTGRSQTTRGRGRSRKSRREFIKISRLTIWIEAYS